MREMKEAHPYDWAVKLAPIGKWSTEAGSANMLMGSLLTLSKDGTGSVTRYSTLFEDVTFHLLWQVQKAGKLQIYQTHEDHPLPEVDTDWDIFTFRADWKELDAGSSPVLINTEVDPKQNWIVEGGFWNLSSPVSLVSRE